MAKQVHGPEYDLRTKDIDREVLMKIKEGKKHVQYWIADSAINLSSTPTLS
jgi:5-formaminoimidazole-4-carboxamide-1-beta-D-ribofuranosyl 5'-monophosphate synthetase